MKRKILLGICIGLLVIIVAMVVVVGFFLGDVVKAGMEAVGPKVTQTSLAVGSVTVSVLTGSAEVNNLMLGNPDEYKAKAPDAISVGKASVRVEPLSTLSGKIVIKSVEVRSPVITFVGNPLGANNLKKIMDNVNAFTSEGPAKPVATNAPASAVVPRPPKKLEVDSFLITNAIVHFNGVTLPLPNIYLTDLGKGPDGITPGDLTKKVLGEITDATLKVVISSAGNAGKALGGEASKLGKSLGGLLGK